MFQNFSIFNVSDSLKLIRNIAFVDEFEVSKESKLQSGFEAGYIGAWKDAVNAGRELGRLSIIAVLDDLNGSAHRNTPRVHREEALQIAERVRKQMLSSGGGHSFFRPSSPPSVNKEL